MLQNHLFVYSFCLYLFLSLSSLPKLVETFAACYLKFTSSQIFCLPSQSVSTLTSPKWFFFAEVLLKTVVETIELKAWSKYQVHFQKVTDIRWARLRGPGPYYRHWPVKYSIAYEHAQQNGIISEDVTPYTKVTHPGRAVAESPTRVITFLSLFDPMFLQTTGFSQCCYVLYRSMHSEKKTKIRTIPGNIQAQFWKKSINFIVSVN